MDGYKLKMENPTDTFMGWKDCVSVNSSDAGNLIIKTNKRLYEIGSNEKSGTIPRIELSYQDCLLTINDIIVSHVKVKNKYQKISLEENKAREYFERFYKEYQKLLENENEATLTVVCSPLFKIIDDAIEAKKAADLENKVNQDTTELSQS